MTLLALLVGWVALAALVSPWFRDALVKLRPRLQAVLTFAATVALALIPASAASIAVAGALPTVSSGSLVERCGKLVAAIAAEPLARPEVTVLLVALAAALPSFVVAALRAWLSQRLPASLRSSKDNEYLVIPVQDPLAFTAGLLRPRVVVSEGFLETTDEAWQAVVLAHEEAHRRGHHPLFLFLAETIARALPLRPLRWGADSFRLALETIADDYAAEHVRDRAAVAEAIAEVALHATPAVGFEGDEVRRCRRLLVESSRRSRLGIALVAAVMAMVAFSGGHAVHCVDASVDALSVTQCRVPS